MVKAEAGIAADLEAVATAAGVEIVADASGDGEGLPHYIRNRRDVRQNPLLQPNVVGQGRRPTHPLPDDGFTYGKKVEWNSENAGQVISSWHAAAQSKQRKPGRDHRRTNVLAIRKGYTSAKEFNDFKRTHDIRLRRGKGDGRKPSDEGDVSLQSPKDIRHGTKNRPSTPFNRVIEAEFQKEFLRSQAEKAQLLTQEAQPIPVMHTRASLGHAAVAKERIEPEEPTTGTFVMRKFQNVESRVFSS